MYKMDWKEWRAVAKTGGFCEIVIYRCDEGLMIVGTDRSGTTHYLPTRRGAIRYYGSLDTAFGFLTGLGIWRFSVIDNVFSSSESIA